MAWWRVSPELLQIQLRSPRALTLTLVLQRNPHKEHTNSAQLRDCTHNLLAVTQ